MFVSQASDQTREVRGEPTPYPVARPLILEPKNQGLDLEVEELCQDVEALPDEAVALNSRDAF